MAEPTEIPFQRCLRVGVSPDGNRIGFIFELPDGNPIEFSIPYDSSLELAFDLMGILAKAQEIKDAISPVAPGAAQIRAALPLKTFQILRGNENSVGLRLEIPNGFGFLFHIESDQLKRLVSELADWHQTTAKPA